jgi:hypothetical protein
MERETFWDIGKRRIMSAIDDALRAPAIDVSTGVWVSMRPSRRPDAPAAS